MEVVCFAVIPVLAAIFAGIYAVVRISLRDEVRLRDRAHTQAVVIATGDSTLRELPQEARLDHLDTILVAALPRHLYERVDFARVLEVLGF